MYTSFFDIRELVVDIGEWSRVLCCLSQLYLLGGFGIEYCNSFGNFVH